MQRRQTYSLQQDLYRVTRDRDALEENNRNLLSLVEWSRYSSDLQQPTMSFSTKQVAGKSGDGRGRTQEGEGERKDEGKEDREGERKGEREGKEEQQQSPKQSLWKRILHLFQRKPVEGENKRTTSPSHPRNRSASSPIPTGKEDGEYLQLQVPPHILDANYPSVNSTPRSKSEDYPRSKEELYSLRRRYSHKSLSSHHSFLSNSFSNLQSPRRSSLLARVSRSPSETRSVSSESSYKNEMIHGLRIGLAMDDESDDENTSLGF